MPRTTRPLDDDNMRAVVGSENSRANMRKKESHDTIPTTILHDKNHDITTAASNAEDEKNADSEQIITVTTTTTSRKDNTKLQSILLFFHLSVDTRKISFDTHSI
jgi:hypothetical protein